MFDFGYITHPDTEAQYFLSHEPIVQIPVSDVVAYQMYPQYRWMFNKITLSEVQGIWAYPDRYPPPSFPIIHKPITNLYGMSAGVTTIASELEYDSIYKPGYMIMPRIEGEQYSTDVVLLGGHVIWAYTFQAHKNEHDSFTLWEGQDLPSSTYNILLDWLQKYFPFFTGIVNFETINQTIIECQPRMSAQFVDLYGGDQWLYSVTGLYQHGVWKHNNWTPTTAYSLPLRMKQKIKCHLPGSIVDRAKRHCSSIQLFIDDFETHTDDEYSKRIAVVNCFNLEEGRKAIQILKDNIITDNNRSITWI